ncbi:MAG TPA: beta-N-acetylglucosaminidase domain-containing protein [Verrucomicrobiota bacterium]|nr:beta-N-acetylglucosaminidase domain-containing protein [Verrucomicrobiota bacterium]HRZ35297.1 beta-N-acetylglucosaminidase domain-containing protein [Candidatus Paceibacterota bacterium]
MLTTGPRITALTALACASFLALDALAATALVEMPGLTFQGGAQTHFGATHYGRTEVNYVYAQSTGAAASMTARFQLERVPRSRLFLHLEAMDDDAASPCQVRLALNGLVLHEGPSGFPDARWACHRFAVPADALRAGTNELTIVNLEKSGPLGAPPWFMVARAALAGSKYTVPTVAIPRLDVRLPGARRAIPEPLRDASAKPGFAIRGTKGWLWTPEQYLEEIPTLADLKLNFLMNCYGSMFTSEPGTPWRNEWWLPMTQSRKEAYARIIRSCRDHGITFCFAFHPQLASPRPLDPTSDSDLGQFYQHYAWAQSQGVRWFSVSLDDVSWGSEGPATGGMRHARLVNALFGRLRAQDSEAQMIFCPVPYWGDGTNPEHRAYLETLGRDLHPDAYVFWTGDAVVTPRITRQAAESYKSIVRHRLFLWDNYPVNDASPTLHLGPVSGRDPDLGEVVDGYMSNPLASQSRINRIPLATCADYAYNPRAYDPRRSIGQAILRLAKTAAQRRALEELVETYPGFLVTGGGTGTNPVRGEFGSLLASEKSPSAASEFVRRLERLGDRLARAFPGQFPATEKTVADDLGWMRQQLSADRERP